VYKIILSAHQPAYLPWLGLFHKIMLSDIFVIFDEVQFIKDSFDNRNKIKTSSAALWLTVPILTKGRFPLLLRDAVIDNVHNLVWRKKHLSAVENSYRKAPYFDKYIDFFRDLYGQEWNEFLPLCDKIFKYLLLELCIDTKILYAHDHDFKRQKSDLVLDMCQKLNADLFIFGALGRNYAKKEDFERSGIFIYFQDYRHPCYSQLYGDFIGHLSVIDLLFNVGGKRASEIILEGNISKKELMEMYKL